MLIHLKIIESRRIGTSCIKGLLLYASKSSPILFLFLSYFLNFLLFSIIHAIQAWKDHIPNANSVFGQIFLTALWQAKQSVISHCLYDKVWWVRLLAPRSVAMGNRKIVSACWRVACRWQWQDWKVNRIYHFLPRRGSTAFHLTDYLLNAARCYHPPPQRRNYEMSWKN